MHILDEWKVWQMADEKTCLNNMKNENGGGRGEYCEKTLVQRDVLKKPFGGILCGEELENALRKFHSEGKEIICVGDSSAKFLLERNIEPRVLIYDNRIKRFDADEHTKRMIEKFKAKEIRICNPPGKITKELLDAVTSALRDKERIKIFTIGEEDLAALVVFMNAPEGVVVVYGQPDKGMVVSVQTKDKHDKAWKIFEECFE